MLFLDLAEILHNVGNAVIQACRTVCGWICVPLYNLIIYFYDLFTYVSRLEILDSGPVQDIYRKVGLLLGVFMVFKLSFTLIKSLIDPSKLNDKENGYAQIITRSIVSIVLLGITPFIFREAMNIQNLVIGNTENGSNFLYRLIVEDNTEINSSTFGRKLASELFFSFYVKNPYASWDDLVTHENGQSFDMSYETIKEQLEDGTLGFGDLVLRYLHYTDGSGAYLVDFDGLLCLVAGVITCYLLLSFTIEVSIRIFQLIFLQVIAPIPILSYISDSKGTFQKWIKQCTTTYFDVFIRLSIIYFVVFISSFIMDNKDSILPVNAGGFFQVVVEFFLIIGLLVFAKKAPNLIKDLFPISSNAASIGYGKLTTNLKDAWSTTKNLAKPINPVVGGVAGGIAGLATGIKYGKGTLAGRFGGAVTGLGRGFTSGAKMDGKYVANTKKAIEKQRSAMMKAYERNNDGSNWRGRNFTAYADQRLAEAYDKEISSYSDFTSNWDAIDKELEKQDNVKYAMQEKQTIMELMAKGELKKTITNPDGSAGEREYTLAEKQAEIKRLSDNIDNAKQEAFRTQLAIENSKIRNFVDNAEKIRDNGHKKGYTGYGENQFTYDVMDSNATDAEKNAFADNLFTDIKGTKKNGQNRTHDIKDVGGKEHERYQQAKDNSKYSKK